MPEPGKRSLLRDALPGRERPLAADGSAGDERDFLVIWRAPSAARHGVVKGLR